MAIASDETAELTGSFVQDDFPFLIFFMNMCNNFEHPIEETSSEHPQKALLSTCSILCRYPLVRNQISSYGMILWKQRHTCYLFQINTMFSHMFIYLTTMKTNKLCFLISRDFPMNTFICFLVIAQPRNPSFTWCPSDSCPPGVERPVRCRRWCQCEICWDELICIYYIYIYLPIYILLYH